MIIPAFAILFPGHSLEVEWVEAQAVAADVIDFRLAWQISVEDRVCNAMNCRRLSVN